MFNLPAVTIPKEFRLHAKPAPGQTVAVFWETPAGSETIGTFEKYDYRASILLNISLFSEWKPSAFVKMGMNMLHLPEDFELCAIPSAKYVDLRLSVAIHGSTNAFSRSKRIDTEKWDLGSMKDFIEWLREAKAEADVSSAH